MILFAVAMAILPLAYLPIFGSETPFGVLSTSDFVLPFVYALLLPRLTWRGNRPVMPRDLKIAFSLFLGWALFSTMTIPMRFGTSAEPEFHTINGLLKLGKFVEYSLFGFLVLPWLDCARHLRIFKLSLLASMTVLGANSGYLLYTMGGSIAEAENLKSLIPGGANGVSVLLALLLVYWCGMVIYFKHRLAVLLCIIGAVVIALGGIACTLGRGGWVALVCGGVYLFVVMGGLRRLSGRMLLLSATAMTAVASLVLVVPQVYERVAVTLDPSLGLNYSYTGGTVTDNLGVDDGGRIDTALNSILRTAYNPVFGSGFFHRGGESGVYYSGTHNFFIEILQTLGVPGALLLGWIWYLLWFRVGRGSPYPPGNITANQLFRSVMVAATVACLSGEYLYGGLVLSSFSAMVAMCVAESRLVVMQRSFAVFPRDLLSRRFLLAGSQPGLPS